MCGAGDAERRGTVTLSGVRDSDCSRNGNRRERACHEQLTTASSATVSMQNTIIVKMKSFKIERLLIPLILPC
jgi:hypothetical protein